MKTIICLILVSTLALTSAYTARPQPFSKPARNTYHQPAASTNAYKASSPHSVSHSASSSSEKESQILRNDVEVKGDGTYHYDFETSNGIKRSEQGAVDGTIQGSSSYISPEGIEIKTSYVADETGYHPVGDHIPQIPDYIVRALEYIRTHPYVEKDYYTGEVKSNEVHNNRNQHYSAPITTKRSAYNNNKKANNNSKYNFKH